MKTKWFLIGALLAGLGACGGEPTSDEATATEELRSACTTMCMVGYVHNAHCECVPEHGKR